MMQNLLQNWKTTSAGVVLILTGLIHIAFGIIHKTVTETDFTTTMVSVVTGIGLIVAGDGSKSIAAHEETKKLISELQERSNSVPNAIESHDTSLLRNVPITPVTVQPAPSVAKPPVAP